VSPVSLQFTAYTPAELISIVTYRLNMIEGGASVIDSKALDLVARKVADIGGGDCRKILDICLYATAPPFARSTLVATGLLTDFLLCLVLSRFFSQLVNKLEQKLKQAASLGTTVSVAKVTVGDVMPVIKMHFETGRQTGNALITQLKELPLHQQLVMVASLLSCKPAKVGGEAKQVKMSVIVDKYKAICSAARLKLPAMEEIVGSFEMVASTNLIQFITTGTKAGVKALVQRPTTLVANADDIIEAFKDNLLVKEWISDLLEKK